MKRIQSASSWCQIIGSFLLITSFLPLVGFSGNFLRCHHCGRNCEMHQLVEKTVMIPKTVVETRAKNCLVTKIEEREEKYTVFVLKPEKREFKKTCKYLDDEVKTQEITCSTPKLVDVPVTRTRHVKVLEPFLVEQTFQKQICTECGPVCIEETCTVEKNRLVDSTCVEESTEKQLVFDVTKKEINYCVKTPKTYEIPCVEESTFTLVPEERTRKVQVCIPKFEKQNYEVETTRMVPCKVLVCEKCRG